MQEKFKMRWVVVAVPVTIFSALIILGFFNAQLFTEKLWAFFEYLTVSTGWLVELGVLAMVIFLLILCFHPVGKIKFGGKDAQPKFSTWNWWAISLCAGIGTGIVFWGPVEPLMHALSPAGGTGLVGGTSEAITWAMEKTFFHWTFAPYAIYVTVGVVVGYAYYNMKQSYSISSGFYPMIGEKSNSPKFATFIDTLAAFAITGGVAGSLGYGLLQIGSGIESVFGIKTGPTLWVIIAILIVATYLTSSISGLNNGIRWLSDKNAWMFIGLMLLVLFTGPIEYMLNITTQSFGSFLSNFPAIATFTDPGGVDLWPQWWDVYWLIDWLSFGPIVGLFLIKLCYGRTIREFVLVNWMLPSLFGIIWFGIFGGFALDLQLFQNIDLFAFLNANGTESLMLKVLEYIPFTQLIRPIMLVLVALSFVTLGDSMTSTVALMSIKNNKEMDEAPMKVKFFWGILMGLTAVIFTLNGGSDGLEGIKVVKTLAGFPILFIEVSMMIGFITHMYKKGVIERREQMKIKDTDMAYYNVRKNESIVLDSKESIQEN